MIFIHSINRCFLLSLFVAGILSPILCYSHDWPVHQKITASAFQSSAAVNEFVDENGGNQSLTASPPQGEPGGNHFPSDWLQQGSIFEDEQKVFGRTELRTVDHFYTLAPYRTPGQVFGLYDYIPTYYLPDNIVNSFIWASQDGVFGPVYHFGVTVSLGTNVYNWHSARNYEYAALTSTNQSDRNKNMALMLYSLGHILHLNQDLTSPDHVRNDNHFSKAYFEDYGKKHYLQNPQWFNQQSHGWSYWQSNGFIKLLDFWDRNLYKNNSSDALNQEAAGSVKLGLAEWSNGNFLGEDALYNEIVPDSDPYHHFPFPSLLTSTDFPQQRNNLVANIDQLTYPDGTVGNSIYFKKTGDGISVTHHSRLTYLGVRFIKDHPTLAVSTTIGDDNVLQDYHNILIPKAVEYSAGLLDYFFRGTMSVSLNWDTNTDLYTFTNKNTSGQDFYNGAFSLFEEDTNGIRTLAQQYPLSGILPDGSSTNITYPGPAPSGTKFLVVYQGTIGQTNDSALDPVDANIGIAAARPEVEQTKTYNYQVSLDSLGLSPGATIETNLESDDFSVPLTSGNYEVTVNYANFDDAGTIGSLTSASGEVASCTLPSTISNMTVPTSDISITPDGQRLSVHVTATDDPVCSGDIGWWTITITWKVVATVQ